MNTRFIAGLALTALITVPTLAGAQTSSTMSSTTTKPMTGSSSKTMTKKKSSMKSAHKAKAGQAQSTSPGAPNYSGSSGTGH
jgi:hypothetical protein